MIILYPFINITDTIAKCIHIKQKNQKIKFTLVWNTKNEILIWYDKKTQKYYYKLSFDKNISLKEKFVTRDTKESLWESLEPNITKILDFFKRNNIYSTTLNYKNLDDYSLKSLFENFEENKVDDFFVWNQSRKLYSEEKKIWMEYLYDIGYWFEDLREDIKIIRNIIYINLKDPLKVPIQPNAKIENYPNKFFNILHYFKIEIKLNYNWKNICIYSEGYSSSDKIKLLAKKYYDTYEYTGDEQYKGLSIKLLNISDNSLFNHKSWMTESDFEHKSCCPKCKNVGNTFDIICFNSEVRIDIGKDTELNIQRDDISDFWEYWIISCWNCGYKFLENKYPMEYLSNYTFEWTSSFSCNSCNYYLDPILLWWHKKIYVTYDWIKYSLSFMNSQIKDVSVKSAGQMLSYKCFNCNTKYFL